MQNLCFFYSPLLIQIYWITHYVVLVTGGSDQSSNKPVTSCAHENYRWEILAAWQCEHTIVYYRGITIAMDGYHHQPVANVILISIEPF
jgi:hypothetical protein